MEKKGQREKDVRNGEDQRNVSAFEEVIDEKGENNQIYDYCGSDVAISKLNTGQAFPAAVIFGNRTQNDAPPKVPVNLDVPFLPAGIDGVAPVFMIKQRENFV